MKKLAVVFLLRACLRNAFICTFCFATLILMPPLSVRAATLPSVSVTCGASYDLTFPDLVANGNLCSSSTSMSQTVTSPPLSIPGVVTASGSASVGNGAPQVSASVSLMSSTPTSLSVGGSARLQYYATVLFQTGTGFLETGGPLATLPINVSGNIVSSCPSIENCDGVILIGSAAITDISTGKTVSDQVLYSPSNSQSITVAPYGIDPYYLINVGDTYLISLTAFASQGTCPLGETCQGTITVDPVFSIDTSANPEASDYQLVFSDGVINSNSSATPLPATLPLFVTGLGGLGLFGWRRKRKAQALGACANETSG